MANWPARYCNQVGWTIAQCTRLSSVQVLTRARDSDELSYLQKGSLKHSKASFIFLYFEENVQSRHRVTDQTKAKQVKKQLLWLSNFASICANSFLSISPSPTCHLGFEFEKLEKSTFKSTQKSIITQKSTQG